MLIANVTEAVKRVSSSGVSRQHSQSRENINFPEDEVVAGSDGGIEEIGGSASSGKMHPHQTKSYSCGLKSGLYKVKGYHTHLDTSLLIWSLNFKSNRNYIACFFEKKKSEMKSFYVYLLP